MDIGDKRVQLGFASWGAAVNSGQHASNYPWDLGWKWLTVTGRYHCEVGGCTCPVLWPDVAVRRLSRIAGPARVTLHGPAGLGDGGRATGHAGRLRSEAELRQGGSRGTCATTQESAVRCPGRGIGRADGLFIVNAQGGHRLSDDPRGHTDRHTHTDSGSDGRREVGGTGRLPGNVGGNGQGVQRRLAGRGRRPGDLHPRQGPREHQSGGGLLPEEQPGSEGEAATGTPGPGCRPGLYAPRATIRDCVDTSNFLPVNKTTGQASETDGVHRHVFNSVAQRVDGKWLIGESAIDREQTC